MPIYEYKCNDCGVHTEKRQTVNEAPLAKCESCGGKLEKQWSLSGFQLKGEGWYVTDYSKKKDPVTAPPVAKEKTSTAESTPTPPPASKESKPEKKAEPAAKKD